MADQNIALGVQVPDSFKSISGMLNFAGQAQALRTAQQDYERGGVALEKEKALLKPSIRTGEAAASTAETGSKAAAFKLEGEQAAKAMQIAGGLFADPRIVNSDPNGIIDAATEAEAQMRASGIPEQTARFWSSQIASKAHTPGAAYQMLQNIVQGAAGSGTQAGVLNNSVTPVQTQSGAILPLQLQPKAPGGIQPVQISAAQPSAGQPSGVIPAGVPPASIETPTTDVLGQPAIAVRGQNGQISYKAPPGTDTRPVMQFPAGESQSTLPEVQKIRSEANAAGASAPSQHFNNKAILDLSSDAFTGTGGGRLSKILGSVGLQSKNDIAADTAQLQHFIGLQIENNAKAQGANTDAARSLAAQAVLPTDSPEKAIKAITKVNDAFVTGSELFNKGMEAYINSPANQSGVFAARAFKNAWAQNFDPRITLLENAQKTGDTETINRVLGPKGSKQRETAIRELIPKTKALQALSQGQI